LVVVGVTNDVKDAMEKFISDKGIKYPIALDGSAAGTYGVNGIPDAVLVGSDGKVVWAGDPRGLPESQIEESLKGVTFIPPLPASLTRINLLLRSKKFGKAYLDLKKALQDKKAKEEETASTLSALEGRMKGLLSDGEKARSEGDFYTVARSLNDLKSLFAGTADAKKAAEILKEVEKDQKARDQMKAAETFDKLERAMEAKAFIDAYKGYKSLAKKFSGTRIEKVANDKIAVIEREKLLNYRPGCAACRKDGKTCKEHRV
jgi:hypothetical protein